MAIPAICTTDLWEPGLEGRSYILTSRDSLLSRFLGLRSVAFTVNYFHEPRKLLGVAACLIMTTPGRALDYLSSRLTYLQNQPDGYSGRKWEGLGL